MELAVTLSVDDFNPNVGDLYLSSSGHEVLRTTLAAEVSQRLAVRFNFFQKEWFLDLSEGAPFYQYILVKGAKELTIRSILSNIVLSTPGVGEIISLTWDISKDRVMSVNIEARLRDGSVFRTTDYGQYAILV
jgi:hypothetical protein